MVSTPLVEKIYHHKDKLWGIYNLTGVFKEADYMEISSHHVIVFNIKNKLQLHAKKINISSWHEISSQLADPKLKLSSWGETLFFSI